MEYTNNDGILTGEHLGEIVSSIDLCQASHIGRGHERDVSIHIGQRARTMNTSSDVEILVPAVLDGTTYTDRAALILALGTIASTSCSGGGGITQAELDAATANVAFIDSFYNQEHNLTINNEVVDLGKEILTLVITDGGSDVYEEAIIIDGATTRSAIQFVGVGAPETFRIKAILKA